MNQLFEDEEFLTGLSLDGDMISRAEEALGVRLPRSDVDAISWRKEHWSRREASGREAGIAYSHQQSSRNREDSVGQER